MAVRSEKIWAVTLVGRPSGLVYSVPAERTLILKSVYVYLGGGLLTSVELVAHQPSPSVFAVIAHWELQDFERGDWSGWIVLEGGDEVSLNYDHGPLSTWGSGALLP